MLHARHRTRQGLGVNTRPLHFVVAVLVASTLLGISVFDVIDQLAAAAPTAEATS